MSRVALLAIGIPGSGKTTVLAPLAQSHGFTYINRDDIRKELLGDATDQSQNKRVWEEANRRTAEALLAGRDVLLDATFVESWKRKDMISFLREHGVDRILGIVFTTPLEIAQERNTLRERTVPSQVLEDMHAALIKTPPSLSEGFDALYTDAQLSDLISTEFPPST